VNNFTIGQHTFPPQPTPFIGRQEELRQIMALLVDPVCRLLTLVGPGGIGKTRLALAAAVQNHYTDGVYFVGLQPLASADHIFPVIADALGIQFFAGDEPKAQLLHFLSSKSLLLILDNLEHLLEGVGLITDILAAAPDVKMLATSRERLNLREEWVFDVGALPFPADEADPDAENYSAVALFTQNARRVRPGFSFKGERVGVVRICQLVGGMPLGIELAATWARTLSCNEIARQLERGLDILATPARNMPERHQSMRVVLDHSWALLSVAEATTFSRLAVFRGGFTVEAAEAVAGASLPILAALVDKSWLRFDAATGRYDAHELMRQYGAEQLEPLGGGDAARTAHCDYFAGFMQARERDIKYRRQIPALDEIEADFDNVRAAWEWGVQQRDRDAIRHMTEALNFFCDMRAR